MASSLSGLGLQPPSWKFSRGSVAPANMMPLSCSAPRLPAAHLFLGSFYFLSPLFNTTQTPTKQEKAEIGEAESKVLFKCFKEIMVKMKSRSSSSWSKVHGMHPFWYIFYHIKSWMRTKDKEKPFLWHLEQDRIVFDFGILLHTGNSK